jgi:hypothetical protein
MQLSPQQRITCLQAPHLLRTFPLCTNPGRRYDTLRELIDQRVRLLTNAVSSDRINAESPDQGVFAERDTSRAAVTHIAVGWFGRRVHTTLSTVLFPRPVPRLGLRRHAATGASPWQALLATLNHEGYQRQGKGDAACSDLNVDFLTQRRDAMQSEGICVGEVRVGLTREIDAELAARTGAPRRGDVRTSVVVTLAAMLAAMLAATVLGAAASVAWYLFFYGKVAGGGYGIAEALVGGLGFGALVYWWTDAGE